MTTMTTSVSKVSKSPKLVIVLLVLLSLSVLANVGFLQRSFAAGVTDNIYFHHDPNSSYTVGTVSTGGLTLNSTQLGFSSSGYTWTSTSGASNTYWYISQLLAGQISISGTPTLKVDMFSTATDSWNYTIQIYYQTSSAGGITQLSDLSCSNSCFSTTTSQILYSFAMPPISTTTIPSTEMLVVYLGFSSTVTTKVLYTIVDSNSLTSYLGLPLSSSPVTVNSLNLSPNSITNPSTSTATLSVSDAFGLYDIASSKLSATISGTSITAINAQAMSASSSNSLSAYTGSYITTVNPSATSYSSYNGIWNIQSTVQDNSGNSYTSSVQTLDYEASGSSNGVSTTTTTTHRGGGYLSQFQIEILFLTFLAIIALVGIVVWRSRR